MDRKILKLHKSNEVGNVHIADEVIAIIAALTVTEVEGVCGMASSFTGDLVEMLGRKNLAKGVEIELGEDEKVNVSLAIIVDYGYSVIEVTDSVQEKVKNAIETMTDLKVDQVNIKVAGVNTEEK